MEKMSLYLNGRSTPIANRGTSPKGITVEYKGESLLFAFVKGRKLDVQGDNPVLYGYALEFLRLYDLEDKFFNLYKEAYDAKFLVLGNTEEKLRTLKYLMGKALEDLVEDDLITFLENHKDIDNFISSKVKSSLDLVSISDGEGTKAQTYTREDYVGLVALTLQQQLLLPIFADYIPDPFLKEKALDKPNSLMVLELMIELGVLDKSKGTVRLLDYIDTHILSLSAGNMDKILNISSFYKVTDDDLSLFILSHVLCRLLPVTQPVCRHKGKDIYKDIATAVFGFVKNVMTESAIKTPNKINPSDAYNGEGKDGLFESDQSVANISQSDEAMILVSCEARTKGELESRLVILFDKYGLKVEKEDVELLHRHRKQTNDFYIIEINIWLITIFSSVLLPSKYLEILGPEHIYNLNSIIYILVNKLLGEKHAVFYAISFLPLRNTIKVTSSDSIGKTDLERLRPFYPIINVDNNGTKKPVIGLWLTGLRKRLLEYSTKNLLTGSEANIKNKTGMLLDLLVCSVERRK